MVLGRENSRVLALESSWCDGIAVVAPPLLDVVATVNEELSGRVTARAGPERNSV
jgi:hypothetical protein